jgi:Flp pilus assembly protein TadG
MTSPERRRKVNRRSGASAVEFAVVAPITLLMIIGLFVGGTGIFRDQEVASLAREASRWASVHGTQYAAASGKPAATAADVYNQVIAPKAVILNPADISYSVTWNASNSPYHTQIVGGIANGDVVAVTNTVTVTVNYQWIPEAYLGGVMLTSTSTVNMCF